MASAVAILKLSYNRGESSVEGGICGGAFFINEKTALTANHLLSTSSYKPNEGYSNCQYWLISRGGEVIDLKKEYLIDLPQIDTTIIKFPRNQVIGNTFELSTDPPRAGEEVLTQGFVGNAMPETSATWGRNGLLINSIDLGNVIADRQGFIKSIKTADVNARDIKMKNVKCIELSFPGIIGGSGGPVIRKSTGKVIGLMAIGLPPDVPEKALLFAVSVEEINKAIEIK